VSITQRLGALVVVAFALAFTRAPLLIRLFNPVMRWLLVTPLPVGPNALLTVRGRRTGRPRSSPVAFLDFGEMGLVQAASNDVNWVRNLRASREAVISRGGVSKTFDATELAPETAGHVLHDLLAPFPRSRLIGAVAGEDRPPVAVLHYFRLRVDNALADYIRVARRQPVFELRRTSAPHRAEPQPGAVTNPQTRR
jgi:deazaflavin-dependent oxidoreductase (nitroreductase family)